MGIEALGTSPDLNTGFPPHAANIPEGSNPVTKAAAGHPQAANDDAPAARFQQAAATPAARAALQRAGIDQSRPPEPKDLLDYLSRRPYGLTSPNAAGIETFRTNIELFLDEAKTNAERQPGATAESVALAQNSALKLVYSALATEVPNFQWTYVGGFVAQQVRGNIEMLGDTSAASKFGGASGPIGGIVGPIASVTSDHVIDKLIEGQRTVVTDVGSHALAYRAYGAEALSKAAPDPAMRAAFQIQARADAAAAHGDPRAAAEYGKQAAIAIGVFEQRQLQPMWEDVAVRASAEGASMVGMVNTDIQTAIGTIPTPQMEGGPWDLEYRIGIATNAFEYMHDKVFTPSSQSAGNQAAVQDYFRQTWDDGNVQWGTSQDAR